MLSRRANWGCRVSVAPGTRDLRMIEVEVQIELGAKEDRLDFCL